MVLVFSREDDARRVLAVYAPKESGDGKIEIQIDGEAQATADLAASGSREAQQLLAEVSGLTHDQHHQSWSWTGGRRCHRRQVGCSPPKPKW
jgi:hypothetical protein